MLEAKMYPPFTHWLEQNTDMFMQEPLIPAAACFDFIAFKDVYLVVYELKVNNAKKVIQQANMSILWCDHSYAVMPEDKIHLGIKYRAMLCDTSGLMSLNMKDGAVKTIIEPEKRTSHITSPQLRKSMTQWILRDYIDRHMKYIAEWKNYSICERIKSKQKKRTRKGKK